MNIKPLLEYIGNNVDLTEEEEAFLESKVNYRKYLKGQYVVQQGDVCKIECFVVSGCTKMFHMDEAGQEHIVMFSIENWWTGDMGSFITQTPSDFNVQCSLKKVTRTLSSEFHNTWLLLTWALPKSFCLKLKTKLP